MITTDFSGTGVAIVTPFNTNKSIDYTSLEKIIKHIIAGKAEYIVVLGTTGESVTLSKTEKHEVSQFIINHTKGKIPLVLGIGGNNTSEIVKSIESTNLNDISGILSVSPYYNKPTQEGIYQHFEAIAKSTDKPIIVYNVPGRTGSNIAAETTLRLAGNFSHIAAIKEASGDLNQAMQIIKNKPDTLQVLSGDDALTYSMVNLGGDGVISVVANAFPFEFSEMVRAARNGMNQAARLFQYQLIDFINLLFAEGSPAGIKAALTNMGLCQNELRLPLTPASVQLSKKIEAEINKIRG